MSESDIRQYYDSLRIMRDQLLQLPDNQLQQASELERTLLGMTVESTKMIHELIEMNCTFSRALDAVVVKNEQLAQMLYQQHMSELGGSC